MWRRRLVSSGLAAASLLVSTTAAVTAGGSAVGADIAVPTATFTLVADSATDTALTFTGASTVQSVPVLIFSADSISAATASVTEPCRTDASGSWQDSQTFGGFDMGGPITFEATDLGYDGLAADYTPQNPPSPGAVLPTQLAHLKLVAYGLVASSLSDRQITTVMGSCG